VNFQIADFETVAVKVLKFADGEVFLSFNPFVGKRIVYRRIVGRLKLKVGFEKYRTFERIELFPLFTVSGEVETLFLVEKGRKPALVVPKPKLLPEVKSNPSLSSYGVIVRPVSSFGIFTFLYRGGEVLSFETFLRLLLGS